MSYVSLHFSNSTSTSSPLKRNLKLAPNSSAFQPGMIPAPVGLQMGPPMPHHHPDSFAPLPPPQQPPQQQQQQQQPPPQQQVQQIQQVPQQVPQQHQQQHPQQPQHPQQHPQQHQPQNPQHQQPPAPTTPTTSRKRKAAGHQVDPNAAAAAAAHFGAIPDMGVGIATSPPTAKKGRTNTPWSPAEEQRLKAMRDAGSSWSDIAKTFPTRTEGSVKKHWYKDMHYAEFAEDESAALLAAIKDYEANKWKVIGQKVGKPAKACEQYAKEHFGGKT